MEEFMIEFLTEMKYKRVDDLENDILFENIICDDENGKIKVTISYESMNKYFIHVMFIDKTNKIKYIDLPQRVCPYIDHFNVLKTLISLNTFVNSLKTKNFI